MEGDFTGYGGNGDYGGGVFNVSLDVALGENHSGNAPQGSFPDKNSVAGDLSWNSLNRVEKATGWCYCRSLAGSDRCSPIGSWVIGVEKDGKRVYVREESGLVSLAMLTANADIAEVYVLRKLHKEKMKKLEKKTSQEKALKKSDSGCFSILFKKVHPNSVPHSDS
ncbi:Uncharacterized protein Fot_42575 [Forsythia ovata]|uniref:Uncharacterized protein n=1 Tax=Forsythia ovata TaxID=205694 RepID=A0ABD1RLK3_9LAMI